MQIPFQNINPDIFVYGGVVGVFLGILFLMFFLYRRIKWIVDKLASQKSSQLKVITSLRNFILLSLWISIFGMIMFIGFFLRSYYAFTHEEAVAHISIEESDLENSYFVHLSQFISPDSQLNRRFLIKGEQWMLEGDIIKWDNWLNFLGLHTRYRFTRLRGRYLRTTDEQLKAHTIYSLTEEERHPLWRYLYDYGYRLPFISTVYGNAAFQFAGNKKDFDIFVSTSGFLVREIQN